MPRHRDFARCIDACENGDTIAGAGDVVINEGRMNANELRRETSAVGEMVLFDNGVIVHTLNEGALVDPAAAGDVLEKTKHLAAGAPVAVVVDLTRLAFADHRSREMFAHDPAGGVEIATALVASARISEFLASQFKKSAQSGRPVELFDSVDEAVLWAAEHVRSAHDS